jgi:hypothetical protein
MGLNVSVASNKSNLSRERSSSFVYDADENGRRNSSAK